MYPFLVFLDLLLQLLWWLGPPDLSDNLNRVREVRSLRTAQEKRTVCHTPRQPGETIRISARSRRNPDE